MHILVTNDDGIFAPGVLALQAALRKIPGTKVTIMAPLTNQSLAGHRKTMSEPLRITEVKLHDGTPGFGCTGSPADAIALALMGYIKEKVDIVVSGINQGANLGQDITYSGTVTAAMEATIFKVPGIAISLDSFDEPAFEYAAEYATRLTPLVYEKGLPEFTLLNVNFPLGKPTGVKLTRQGRRVYYDELIVRRDPFNKPYYWIGNTDPPGGDIEEIGTDIWAIANSFISITPISLDMTNQSMLTELSEWNMPHE